MPRAVIFAAPHRLLFLVGSLNLVLLLSWWGAVLVDLHVGPVWGSAPQIPLTLLHAPAMLFLVFPPYFFGFLLTVFPRWTGYPDLTLRQYAPVGLAFAIASAAAWVGLALPATRILTAAFVVAAAGWVFVIWPLLAVLLAERRDRRGPTWHGWSVIAALLSGFVGLVLVVWFLATGDSRAVALASKIGTFGLLLPVFITVAHRMIPFFAGNVVDGYVRWRPHWVLAALWILLTALLALDLAGYPEWQWGPAAALASLTGMMLWRWWPRGRAPGLLLVLLGGFGWIPIGFGLTAMSSLGDLAGLGFGLGRAPAHAFYLGMAGSMVIAMVTRVTLGHSGRPLEMTRAAWAAFCGIQLACLMRIGAGIAGEHGHLLIAAVAVCLVAIIPWVLGNALIYLHRRVDGRPG